MDETAEHVAAPDVPGPDRDRMLVVFQRVRNVWVPKNSSISRDLGIFVDQPAQSIDPHDRQIRCWSSR